jgi:hypothetical protein
VLSRRQTERGGKAFCDAEQSDHHLARCWDARIASQPLLKRQPIMRSLRPGQRRRWERWSGRKTRFYPHLHVLVTKELHTRPSMLPAAPIRATRMGRDPTTNGCKSTLTWRGFAVALPFH